LKELKRRSPELIKCSDFSSMIKHLALSDLRASIRTG
jgi:hypothetical protein